MVFVNEAAFAKLPQPVQKAVLDASAAAEKRVWEISKQQAEDARKVLAKAPHVPMIALGTAHAAKFGDAVEKATGVRAPLPPHLGDIFERKEHFAVLPNDQARVEAFIRDRARAAR